MLVCKIKGVKIKINLLFLVIIFLFALVGDLARALTAFTVVILHEFGHILAARHFKVKLKEVELLPFGGVAVFEGILEMDSKIERRVALAGPMVNFTFVLLAILSTRYGVIPLELALFFISCNLSIGIFNLFPALPLDGGRIFRATLTPWCGYRQATHLTIQITRLLALLVGIWAFVSWLLGKATLLSLVAAFFVYFAAMKEEEQSIYILMKYLTRKKTLLFESECIPGQEYLVLGDTMILHVIKAMDSRSFAQFLIYDRDYQFLGKLTEIDVMNAFFEEGKNVPVRELLASKK